MILGQLAQHAMDRVKEVKNTASFDQLKTQAFSMAKGEERFLNIFKSGSLSFICELKKASPSKGLIDPKFDYLRIAREYEEAGADGISCLTEPRWFRGSDQIFEDVRQQTKLPMLRKDFIVDEYQIFESKVMGADAILLICAILDDAKLTYFIELASKLGLTALVEAHNEAEVKAAISCGAQIIGVNNRNLKDFTVDQHNALKLRHLVPENIFYIAESGISNPVEVRALKEAGIHGLLIGEAMMRSENKVQFLAQLRGEGK